MKKYNLVTTDPVALMVKNSLINLPTPSSISFLWNMGFLLGMTLVLQILTGLVLSMNYVPSTGMAFESVMHIMRDINSGWLIRYLHMNGASLFFMLMYTHMARGIYFLSPKKMPMVWASGVVILLTSMGAAFMGYVLPWGQMSFWGATVITSMLTAIPYFGKDMTQWLWGNFSVSQPTLNRFFSLHFILPLAVGALAVVHLILLHKSGSSNPLGLSPDTDKIKFTPYYAVKDFTPALMISIALVALISISPNLLGDVENFNLASMTTTPPHIQPEWYFLFAYAILRSIPSKLGGVVAMVLSILVLTTLSLKGNHPGNKFSPLKKTAFWCFAGVFILLTWIGANPVEPPFVMVGQAMTLTYFCMFSIL